jgi:hypothetical protein
MTSFHHEVKTGKRGSGSNHATYIARQGKYDDRTDLVFSGHGNMPSWAQDNPRSYWRVGDKNERANGVVFREHVIALPDELTREQQKQLASELVTEFAGRQPFQFAVHDKEAAMGDCPNVHLHLMISERIDDGIPRPPEQMFRRYNPHYPERGGCRKGNCGRDKLQLRDELIASRRMCAEIQNAALARHGHSARVDHRTLREQGVDRKPERHLGAARVNSMSDQDKTSYVAQRAN